MKKFEFTPISHVCRDNFCGYFESRIKCLRAILLKCIVYINFIVKNPNNRKTDEIIGQIALLNSPSFFPDYAMNYRFECNFAAIAVCCFCRISLPRRLRLFNEFRKPHPARQKQQICSLNIYFLLIVYFLISYKNSEKSV